MRSRARVLRSSAAQMRTKSSGILLPILALLEGLTAAGCSSGGRGPSATGSAEVIARTSSALSQADVKRVLLTISGPGIAPDIHTELSPVANGFGGIIGGIPVGSDRLFHGDGTDAAGTTTLYSGDSAPVTISGTKAFVALILQQQTKPDPFQNTAPSLTSVTASSDTVAPGEHIDINATAFDPDTGDLLTFTWDDGGASGIFDDSHNPQTRWTAPSTEGPVTLTIRVHDDKGASAAASFTVNVSASGGSGSASVSASFNDAPTVTGIAVDENPINTGDAVHLGVNATDIDGTVSAWKWTSTCEGTFDQDDIQNPVFLVSGLTTDGTCTFSVKVTDDKQGWNTGTLSVNEGAPISIMPAPVMDSSFQGADVADGNEAITFRAKAHDPSGGSITYTWDDAGAGGAFGTATDANGENQIVWTAPACLEAAAQITVTATSDMTNESVKQTFTITPTANQTCPPAGPVGTAGLTEAVDVNAVGALASSGVVDNGGVSADGNYVLFSSSSTNLTNDDYTGASARSFSSATERTTRRA